MWAATTLTGYARRPADGVDKNLAHLGAIIVVVSFVPGCEIKHPPLAHSPAKPHPRGLCLSIGTGINTLQRHGLRCRDLERFAVSLDLRQLEVLDPFAYRMIGQLDDYFCRSSIGDILAPTARRAH